MSNLMEIQYSSVKIIQDSIGLSTERDCITYVMLNRIEKCDVIVFSI